MFESTVAENYIFAFLFVLFCFVLYTWKKLWNTRVLKYYFSFTIKIQKTADYNQNTISPT